MKLAPAAAMPAATSVTITAWVATPANRLPDELPSDFNTAKSRVRSRAETYRRAATITAAINQISVLVLLIDTRASCRGLRVSLLTSFAVITFNDVGAPA